MNQPHKQYQAPKRHQPPTLGHTQVREDWHIFNTGRKVFFGRTLLAVMGKEHRNRIQVERQKMAQEFQEEALSFNAVKRGGD